MSTRTITGTLRKPGSAALWTSATIKFNLYEPFGSNDGQYPNEEYSVTTHVTLATFSAVLAVPDSGTATYRCELPDGRKFNFSIGAGVGSISFTDILADVYASATDQSSLLTHAALIAGASTLGHIKVGSGLSVDGDGVLSSSGASTFLSLTDTPADYTSQALKLARVNVGETALEFVNGATVYQPLDDDLTTIAGLSSADDNFIVGSAAGWVVESGATVRASLGLVAEAAGDIWAEKAGDTMTGALLHPDGSAAAPAVAFSNDSNLGFFRAGSAQIGVAIAGAEKFRLQTTGGDPLMIMGTGGRMQWSSTTSPAGAAAMFVYGINTNLINYYFTALTNTVNNALTVKHQSTGTPAAGFGSAVILEGKSSTTQDQSMARITTVWNVATHASRVSDVVIDAAYSGGFSEILRGRGGASPLVGFLGATPVVRAAHIANPSGGGTQDAEARTAINAILVILENLGFKATS